MKHAAFTLLSLLLLSVAAPAFAAELKLDPAQAPSPQWIWGPAAPTENQEVFFRAAFTLPLEKGQAAKSALLWATCDNEMEVFINGTRVALSQRWQSPAMVDISKNIVPGRNGVSVRGKNESGIAALILKLRIELPDGKTVDLVTDEKWKTSLDVVQKWWDLDYDDADWKPARIVGKYGVGPWGKIADPGAAAVARGGNKAGRATPAEELKLLPGFKADLVYSVPKAEKGSWVSMCTIPGGRLIVCDQGGPLYRVTPGKGQDDTKVEKIDLPIGHAQGLLWAFDALYVVVNGGGMGGNGAGLYRLTYDKATDKFTEVTRLAKFSGRGGGTAGGEHGPHAVRLGPDKKLYVVAGNFTRIPDGCSPNSPARNFAEDLLNIRNPDGGGHDPTVWAPAGWVARCDKDGKNWELVLNGLRNTYDFDFNLDGQFFLYDSDMEWDTGSPWYRPTRVLMGVPGGEYGWRNGTGKWPDYYPDSLPAVVNTGMGSPTGVTFGYGAKFPAKYQRALYCMDWAYGKLYAVHLTPEGAGYKGTFEPFVSGQGWDGTDVIIGEDGAMYVTIGGRGTQSGLYRISYTGTESTDAVKTAGETLDAAAVDARKLRLLLDTYSGSSSDVLDITWRALAYRDRYVCFAAMRVLERMPRADWEEKALTETKPSIATRALIALIRTATADQAGKPDQADKTNIPNFMQPTPGISQTIGTPKVPATDAQAALQPKVLDALNRIPLTGLSEEQRLELLRAYQLCFIRLGKPTAEQAAALIKRLDPLFPSPSTPMNRELSQLLAYLNAGSFVGKAVPLLAKAPTQEDQLHYALCLRLVSDGWTMEQRKAYFAWLEYAERNYRGGNSFRRFIARIRSDAMAKLSPDETIAITEFLKSQQKAVTAAKVQPPRQFVKNWQMADLVPALEQADKGRNFERGKAAFEAAQCAKCHRFGNEGGGGIGPDITGVGSRFQPADILESILLPSKVISDQYQTVEVRTNDGDVIVGHVEGEDETTITVMTDPFSPDIKARVKKTDIASKKPGKLSLMPEGLIDTLSKEEILDLIVYMRSGGNAKDPAFK
jgi:putative heme-binding domain-containing protein